MSKGHRPPSQLAERLAVRRGEIEQTVLARVHAVEDPNAEGEAEYRRGLRSAVGTALGQAIAVLDGEEARIPQELTAQARLAARTGVSLDVVLRRYLAGHTLLCDYLVQEAGGGEALQRALRAQAALLDQIVIAVTDAYKHEVEQRRRTVEHRHAERVKKVLEGSPVDALELGYELEGWHLGVVAHGPGAPQALREHAAALGHRLLLVRPGGKAIWGWFGANRRTEATDLARRAAADIHSGVLLAIGEPGRGIAGWRLTHRQAKAALSVALRGESRVVSYSEVAIVASVLEDEVLTSSLAELYLAPLAKERDGGTALRETLRAYFATGRNAASAAATLGVSRQTVNSRLHTVEERIGRRLEVCGTAVETALRLWDLRTGTETTPLHPSTDLVT